MNMKRIIPVIFLFGMIALTNSTVAAQLLPRHGFFPMNTSRCGLHTLKGGYGYTITGTTFINSMPFLLAGVGNFNFDGNGNATGHDTTSFNGIISESDITATYTIAANCTGTLTVTFPGPHVIPANIVIDDNGREIRLITTDSGSVATGIMRRQ